ncbi:PDZ domain-containing protein [Paucibacter sp. R3-3]|uniref:PDZ domain-containing protein n=1 Tax=Roseateles agri TaxID=3098619 RepID=A0ABU5DDT0_9BURK|nr:PDZ domain-containing protein [Paucibacter sp. R3-3]MDY0744294.1 PDZ domain-containing protein [Paucibacter sp. R3-3]
MGIRYEIALDEAREHVYRVTLRVDAPAEGPLTVSLPVWIPGSYLVREFARHLNGLVAEQHGSALTVTQLDKASWTVAGCRAGQPLALSYRVYAFDNSVRAAWLDAQRGFFNGTSLCLRVHGAEALPHRLSFSGLPAGWQIATAAARDGDAFVAADYDELVDHPFELGTFWEGSFTAGGVPHRIVIAGALPSFDGERLLGDVQRICETEIALWGGVVPFEHYTFMLNAVDDGHGGLEHRASTALIAPRRDLPRLGQADASDGYVQLLALFSHEYFHSWNVKRLRPAEFARYDYTRENYTELLWFFEGFTSYYDELILVRAGLIDEARYLRLLAGHISGVLATPGRKTQSLAQSSFDAWTRLYRPDENSPNSTISYYSKGGLLGLALDLRLREAGIEAGLDALMRALWQRSGGGPIGEGDVLAEVGKLAGTAVAQALKDWVHGTDDLPLQTLLAPLGVQWRQDRSSVAQRLGLRASESALTGVRVSQVLAGSAAQAAGLSAGDELLGCNGWRLRRLDDALLTLASDAPAALRLLVSRDQRLVELNAELPELGQAAPVLLAVDEKAPESALGRRRAWLSGG